LRELEHCSQLTEEETDTLIRSYTLLRGLENRIQLIDDAQTHEVPSDRTALFALYEQDDHKALEKQFLQARQLVHELFQSVFSDQNEEHLSLDPSLKVEKSLSKRSHDIIEIWNAGFGNYGVSLELAPKLMPLSAALNNLIAQSPNPDDIIEAVDIYLRKLPPGGQYLLLLANNPELVRDILSPLTSGGAMARLLNHSPHVVDTLIQRSGQTGSTKAGRSEHGDFVFKQRDYESRLEAMRLHVNEMLYLAYLSAWRGEISASQCRELLTKLAREALQKTLKLRRYPLHRSLREAWHGRDDARIRSRYRFYCPRRKFDGIS